jgi:uncharacterized protein (DUF1778 family)
MMLSADEYKRMWDLIENPPLPNDKLRQAFAKHQDLLHAPH